MVEFGSTNLELMILPGRHIRILSGRHNERLVGRERERE